MLVSFLQIKGSHAASRHMAPRSFTLKPLFFFSPINTLGACLCRASIFVWNVSTRLKISSRMPWVVFQREEHKFPCLGRKKDKRGAVIIFSHDWGGALLGREKIKDEQCEFQAEKLPSQEVVGDARLFLGLRKTAVRW